MSKPRVLIAEDDAANRQLLELILTHAGDEVVACRDGREVLDRCVHRGERYDALILDDLMPNVTGHEAIRLLREHPTTRPLPVLGLSGTVPDSDDPAVAGFDTFVMKPYKPKVLLETLASLIRETPPAPGREDPGSL